MTSLNLVTDRRRLKRSRHPIITTAGFGLCASVIALTAQFIFSYQPILANAEHTAQQQRKQLEQRKVKKDVWKQRQQAKSRRNTFLRGQKRVTREMNALAALLQHTHSEFGEATLQLSQEQLKIDVLYDNVVQVDALKRWLNSHWKNPALTTDVRRQLLPENRVMLTIKRSPQ